jgi:hypothetical protein
MNERIDFGHVMALTVMLSGSITAGQYQAGRRYHWILIRDSGNKKTRHLLAGGGFLVAQKSCTY